MDMHDTNESNDLFSCEGWIVAKHERGVVKIASDVANETQKLNKTTSNWVTLLSPVSSKYTTGTNHECKGPGNSKSKTRSKQYNSKFSDRIYYQKQFLFIRDILNCNLLQNGLSKHYIIYGKLFQKVMLCARITSIENNGDFWRFEVDDGTSAILCIAKKPSLETSVQESVPSTRIGQTNEQILINALESRFKELQITYSTSAFDWTCLGLPVEITACVNEFKGKRFLFAYYVRKISEAFYMQFIRFTLDIYKFRAKHVFEKKY